MLTDSGYLKSARLAGSALIIATTAFIWTAVLYPPIWLRYGEMLVFALFACFLANEAVKRIAARCLLLSLIAAILATVASVIVSILVLPAYDLIRLVFFFTIAVVSILWQRDISGHGWRRKVLWCFIFTIIPPVFAPLHFLDTLGAGGLALILLPIVVGSCLCLWGTGTFWTDKSGGIHPKRTISAWAGTTSAIIMVSGILYAVFPLGTYFVRLALLSLIAIIECALPLFLKPISPLLDWIMNSLRDLINRLNTETEGYFQRYNQEPPREEIESMATPKPVLIFLYILLGALCVFILYSIWKAMVKYHREHQEEQADEIKRDWSSGKAWNWAAKKMKSLASSIILPVKNLLGRRGSEPPDPLARLYAEFLQLAEQAGQARRPSQTPLEFANTLSRAFPSAVDSINTISGLYSRYHYSETPPEFSALSTMMKNMDVFKQVIQDLAKIH